MYASQSLGRARVGIGGGAFYWALAKYVGIFVVLYLFSCGEISGVRPFVFGAYMALVFSGVNILLLSPIYILASFLAFPNVNTVICAVAMSAVLTLADGLHRKFRRNIAVWQMILYALLGQSGFIYVVIASGNNLLNALLTVVLGLLFMLAGVSVFSSILKHRLKYRLDKAELASAGIMVASLALGMQGINIYGISAFRVVGVLIVLVLTHSPGLRYGFCFGFMWGLGGAFLFYETAYIAFFCMCALVASIFTDFKRFFAASSAVLCEIVVGYFFEGYIVFGYPELLSVAIGALIFLLIKERWIASLGELLAGSQDSFAIRHIINRNRGEVAVKLREIARVFTEMRGAFSGMVKGVIDPMEASNMFAEELPERLCTDCKNCDICHVSRKSDCQAAFSDIVSAGVKKGKVSLLDIPPFLASKCGRNTRLLNLVNDFAADYTRYAGNANRLDAAKVLISEQLGGLSDVILALSHDTRQGVGFDIASERRLMEELTYADVVVSEAIITHESAGFDAIDKCVATLIVKTDTLKEGAITKIANKVLKQRMKIASIEESGKAGFSVVTLTRAPRFDVVIGVAGLNKNNAEIGGDAHSFTRVSDDKLVLALCDGMGSGKSAERISGTAISLVENFYRAGFPTDLILASVNKLLILALEESFSALDIAVVDLNTARCDFIKFGSPESVIKHKYECSTIDGGNLPMGVIDELKPVITSKVLNPFDSVVLATDGITDVFGESLASFVNNSKTLNPQSLSSEIVEYAKDLDKQLPHDDMTCLVFRILPS